MSVPEPHPAVLVLAKLAWSAKVKRGARISAKDVQALLSSSLGDLMRDCLSWGSSVVSEGLTPPDLHPKDRS